MSDATKPVPPGEQQDVRIWFPQVKNNGFQVVVITSPDEQAWTIYLFQQVPNRPNNYLWKGSMQGALTSTEFPKEGAATLTVDGLIYGSGGFGWDGKATAHVNIPKDQYMSIRVEDDAGKVLLDTGDPVLLAYGRVSVV
jgi:hypothetical protein